MDIWELHRLHARHLAASRRAPGTVEFYRTGLLRLSEYMATSELGTDLAGLTRSDMQGFVLWLREERGMAPGGELAIMRAVRASLRWGVEEELLARDPMARMKLARAPQTRPPAVTPEVAREALRVAGEGVHPLRDRAVLYVLWDTGIRMSELLQLRVEDVDLHSGFVRVRAETSKRQKERRIPIGVKAGRAVAAWERKRTPARPAIDTLFLSRDGLPWTVSGIHHMLVRVADQLGRSRAELAPHAWRRGFASEYLRHGGDLATLQLLMGHSTLDQVRVYLRISDQDLQKRHLLAGPGDRL